MPTEKKTDATRFLEKLMGGALTFGAMIESTRICDEITQVELARRMGISKSYLCDLEKGRKFPSLEMAAKFGKVLGYAPAYFVQMAITEQIRKAGLKLTVEIKAA